MTFRDRVRSFYHSVLDRGRAILLWTTRKYTKLRRAGRLGGLGDHFLILCVKRPEYVPLTIRNINSLHLQSTGNTVTVYADSVCSPVFERQLRKLDYPGRVQIVNRFEDDRRPWQLLKVEALMHAARKDWILVDADTIWHAQPVIDKTKITFLVKAYRFGDIEAERAFLVESGKKDLLSAPHFVTGFVSIPSRFYSDSLHRQCVEWTQRVFGQASLRRISEEIGVNIAVQSSFPLTNLTALKQSDGPNDTEIMQSLYYGCTNNIEE
jgi:hypothetical protein